MAECLFCGIVAGSVPAFVVADEPAGFAFLDTRPVFKGHVLVVPRTHVTVLGDLPTGDLAPYFGQVSQSVPHLHTHVVPRTKGDGLRGFFWPRTRYTSDDETSLYAEKIAAALG
jgi:histidine triad (HIT) family protein